jgi:ATP-dependent Clp protease ATP-binding subunit ClpA
MHNITGNIDFDGSKPGFPDLGAYPRYAGFFRSAGELARRYNFRFVDVDHVMYELLSESGFRSLITSAGGDPEACRGSLSRSFREHAHFSKPVLLEGVSEGLQRLIDNLDQIGKDPAAKADAGASMAGFYVRVIAVCENSMIAETALMDCGAGSLLMDVDDSNFIDDEMEKNARYNQRMDEQELSEAELYDAVMQSFDNEPEQKRSLKDVLPKPAPAQKPEQKAQPPKSKPAVAKRKGRDETDVNADVDACLTDLSEKARRGAIDPVVGRDEEIDRILSTIRRRRKSSIILSGEAGVGKTAIAEGVALRLLNDGDSNPLSRRPFYELSLQDMVAGTKFRGDFEARMQTLIKRLKEERAIVFIDEFHMIVGSGSTYGRGMDGANMLKTALGRGEITIIGATTPAEMRELRQDAAMMRRFDTMQVREPNREETLEILSRSAHTYLNHHKLIGNHAVLEEICRITDLYQPERRFPDKAFDLLDAACVVAAENNAVGLDVSHVLQASDLLGLRRPKLPDSMTAARIADLEQNMLEDLHDQSDAISELAAEARAASLNFENAGPVSSVLMSGPASARPVVLAESFAKHMALPFVRIDMSQASEQSTLYRLIGLPGVSGADRTGQLVEAGDGHKNLVLMLENIDTVDASVQEFVTNLLKTGLFRAADGRLVSLRGAWIFLSTMSEPETTGQPIGFGRQAAQDDEMAVKLDPGLKDALRRVVRLSAPATTAEQSLARSVVAELVESLSDLGYTLLAEDEVYQTLSELGTKDAIHKAVFGEIRDLVVREIWSGSDQVIRLCKAEGAGFEVLPACDQDMLPA